MSIKKKCNALLHLYHEFYNENYLAFYYFFSDVHGGGLLLPCARLPFGRLGVGR